VAASSAANQESQMNTANESTVSQEVELTELHDMATNACELLKAMANEWRLMILCQLSEGEKTVSELQSLLGLSQSALSQHLAILRREKIVRSRKHAQSVSYSLTGDEATKVMESLHDVFCGAATNEE
jgi:DNA-binding transcriptional ArsR family regulator